MTSPDLPPLLTGHPVDGDPVRVAVNGAVAGRLGAGDLCWSRGAGQAASAIVLEPEGPLDQAMQMVPLMAVAIGDALGAVGPPNLSFGLRWPATLLVNGGEVGRVEAAAPPGTRSGDVPAWLVVGYSVALILPGALSGAPGEAAHLTALHEEGAGDVDALTLTGTVARHFLAWLDHWTYDGFDAVDRAYRAHLLPGTVPATELATAMGIGA